MHFQHFFQHFNGYPFSTRSVWRRAVQLRAPLCSINLGAAADFFQSRQGMVFGDNGRVAISNQLSDQLVKEQVHIASVLNMNNFVEVYLTLGLSLLDTPEDEITYQTSWKKTRSYNLYPSCIFKRMEFGRSENCSGPQSRQVSISVSGDLQASRQGSNPKIDFEMQGP